MIYQWRADQLFADAEGRGIYFILYVYTIYSLHFISGTILGSVSSNNCIANIYKYNCQPLYYFGTAGSHTIIYTSYNITMG